MRFQQSHKPFSEQGAVAIEFALVFPVLFIVMYAIVTYGLILVAQQALTLAASEGARAAVRYQSRNDTLAVRLAAACPMAMQPLGWLQQMAGGSLQCTPEALSAGSPLPAVCNTPNGMPCIRVRVTYNYQQAPLVPHLLGETLRLPTPQRLEGSAVAQINLNY